MTTTTAPPWLDASLHELYAHVYDNFQPDGRPVLDDYLKRARAPIGVLCTLRATAEGMLDQPIGWHRVSWALIEMAAAGRDFSGIALRRFGEKIPEIALAEPGPRTLAVAAQWAKIIRDYKLDTVETGDEAVEAFQRAIGDGKFSDSALAYLAIQEINPTSPSFREAGQEGRVAWLDGLFRRSPALMRALA